MNRKSQRWTGILSFGAIALMAGATSAQVIPGKYIVVLKDSVANPKAMGQQMMAANGGQLGHVYRYALKGFAFQGTAKAAAALLRNPNVVSVEQDHVARILCHQGDPQVVPTGIDRSFASANPNITIDGVDDLRIDAGIASIDTGIDLTHFDLNVVAHTNCIRGGGSCDDTGGNDDNGHGSHTSGTMAAIDNGNGVVGVAPGARLYAVKVLDRRGSGSLSDIVAGIDWVTARANEIDVANMSLGCECTSNAMDTAITNSVAAGITYCVSAGNSSKDTATFSPANHPDVITVSALSDSDGAPGGVGPASCNGDTDDTLADFSNFGPDVEITAPGDCILSTYKDGGCAVLSGTSMSAPHCSGAAALLAASGFVNPADIRNTLISTGNFNWVDDSGDGIQEPLLDVSDTTIFAPATVPGSAGACTPTENPEVTCNDGVDNDCDGAIDCNDSDCSADPACAATCGGKNSPCSSGADCCSGICKKNGSCR